MGNSRAGGCGRLTLFRGHGVASISPNSRLPMGTFVFGEVRHAR